MSPVNRFSMTDMADTDTTLSQIEMALRACGLPLSVQQRAVQPVSTSGWHDVYRVSVPQHAHPFVVRIRKPAAHGDQTYEDCVDAWHAEYVSASLYYMQANRAQADICPSMFLYHVSEEITCTVETYMGERLQLDRVKDEQARRFGRQIGRMMHAMHQTKTHIPGAGEIAWDGANLYGTSSADEGTLTRRIEEAYNGNILLALTEQGPSFDHETVKQKLQAAQQLRNVDEPMVLINRDITPEHLTVQNENRVGIIDPYPYLGSGTRFAAWFIHCYRFLLPSYADTQQHRQRDYDRHTDTLALMADGFERGYIQGDDELRRHLAAERWLWTLEQAYDDLERLTASEGASAEVIRRHGKPDVMRKRLRRSLRLLEKLTF